MTTPADDCGVWGGCQACPLFSAKVCGDPCPADDLTAVAEASGVLSDPDAPDVDPAEPKPEGVGCCGGCCAA